MVMRSVAIEKWPNTRRVNVIAWLHKYYGKGGVEKRWYVDHDFDLINLTMDEDVFITYLLKWPE